MCVTWEQYGLREYCQYFGMHHYPIVVAWLCWEYGNCSIRGRAEPEEVHDTRGHLIHCSEFTKFLCCQADFHRLIFADGLRYSHTHQTGISWD